LKSHEILHGGFTSLIYTSIENRAQILGTVSLPQLGTGGLRKQMSPPKSSPMACQSAVLILGNRSE
jgi:hypothetical protein